MEECLEAMLEEEKQHERNQSSSAWTAATSTENNGAELCQQLNSLRVHDEVANKVRCEFAPNILDVCFVTIYERRDYLILQSTLNPDAEEFVPSFKMQTPPEISAKSS